MSRQRVTRQHIEAKCDIVNSMLGLPEDWSWKTSGAVHIRTGYGGFGVGRYVGDSGGVDDLTGLHTMRECSDFLDGMIAALRIVKEG